MAPKRNISKDPAPAGGASAPAERPPAGLGTKLALAALCLYVLVLAVLTADQVFELGIHPPELDRMIRTRIGVLKDPALTPEQRAQNEELIIGYHEFSVPHLLRALPKAEGAQRESIVRCLQDIALKFFEPEDPEALGRPSPVALRKIASFGDDPVLWKGWWIETKHRLDQTALR